MALLPNGQAILNPLLDLQRVPTDRARADAPALRE